MLSVISLVIGILPEVNAVLAALGGTKMVIKDGIALIGLIKTVVADVKAAKQASSPGGVTVTAGEVEAIALVVAEGIASIFAGSLGLPAGTDALTFAEALAKKLIPLLAAHFGVTIPVSV